MDGSIDESIALAMSMEDQPDVDYATELEHEWLKVGLLNCENID